MLKTFARNWSRLVYDRALIVLAVAASITLLAFNFASHISVSTRLEELMPEGAKSVQTLNAVLRKTGSFASIQIVAQADDPGAALSFIKAAKSKIDGFDWVDYSQYAEDVENLARHKLLWSEEEELLNLEREVDDTYPVYLAQKLSQTIGAKVTFTIKDRNLTAHSETQVNQARIDNLTASLREPPERKRLFTTDDGRMVALMVWPKSGFDSLTQAKRMVDDAQRVTHSLSASFGGKVTTGVAGRIANKVAQFEAVTGDLKLGLIFSIVLIALLIAAFYRSLIVVPMIMLPLAVGLLWTLGVTAIIVGGLNLITVFLVLILFGLGIDFGIHNLSRYQEERRGGAAVAGALEIVITETGAASLIAALTTSLAFFSLMFTEFRAFSEFGFIAGAGIALIFASMYSVFPALIALAERLSFGPNLASAHIVKPAPGKTNLPRASDFALPVTIVAVIFAAIFAPQVSFERNFKNLEASQPQSLIWATRAADRVFGSSHDRAVLAVETRDEVEAIDAYFRRKLKSDVDTPTIEKISSVLQFIPPPEIQRRRLEIIGRLDIQADELKYVDRDLYAAAKQYLTIDALTDQDLPQGLRRTFLGADNTPGYLIYIYNAVSMDDSALARQFYDDAAMFRVGGRDYQSASEGFIFVEMIALMKADAAKAILLVTLTTAMLVLVFTRSLAATAIILTPSVLGVFITAGIMGATGLSLSIINMVVLPSLIGISVDNAIHLYHRAHREGSHTGDAPDIAAIMATTGRAALLTTLTTLIGFGGLVAASMGGLRSMGALAIIGFTICLAMTWILLPRLLELRQRPMLKMSSHYAAN